MEKKHIITLAGDLASGKGSVSKLLQEELGYEIYRNGDYVRGLAKEAGMSIKDYNIYIEDHPEIDRQIEKSAGEYAISHDNLIIDARLGWYAVPNSFKVYLKTDIDVGAARAMNDKNRASTETYSSLEQAKTDIKIRFELENKRFLHLYGVDKSDMSNYDFVLDTTKLNPEITKEEILKAYLKWLEI